MLDARRQRLLEAMGVTLYRLRGAEPSSHAGSQVDAPADACADVRADTQARAHVRESAHTDTPALVVVGAHADRVHADALARALALAPTRLAFIDATPERLASTPPQATAYLALGAAFARPLGAELPTSVQQSAQIVVTSTPAEWRSANAKRALWQALKPLRRALARG